MSKWNADIIRNEETGEYRAILSFDDKPDIEVHGNDYRKLLDNVVFLTGIRFPRKKYLKFSRLSDWETIAGIDASHVRESCIVTAADRKAGWNRWEIRNTAQEVRKVNRLIITIDGGLVSNVYTDSGEVFDISVIDYDCINDPDYESEKRFDIAELESRKDLHAIW